MNATSKLTVLYCGLRRLRYFCYYILYVYYRVVDLLCGEQFDGSLTVMLHWTKCICLCTVTMIHTACVYGINPNFCGCMS